MSNLDLIKCAPPSPAEYDAPLVEGGRGRDAKSVERSARVVAWCVVGVVVIGLVVAAVAAGGGAK